RRLPRLLAPPAPPGASRAPRNFGRRSPIHSPKPLRCIGVVPVQVLSPAQFNARFDDLGIEAVDANGNGIVDSGDVFLKRQNESRGLLNAAEVVALAQARGVNVVAMPTTDTVEPSRCQKPPTVSDAS